MPHRLLLPTLVLTIATLSAGGVAVTKRASDEGTAATIAPAETVTLSPGTFTYPLPGEYLFEGRRVPAPVKVVRLDAPLEIMKQQVGLADYRLCVDAGACQPSNAPPAGAGDVPVTGVNYRDAVAYARWYGEATGMTWRLPSDEEWAYAAHERFAGDRLELADDPDNPAIAWIRDYQRAAAYGRQPDPNPRPHGHFGTNTRGLDDLAGNVWEWTSTCYTRVALDAEGGDVRNRTENCGVRVLEGSHRAYMSDFIREGKSGGCAVGTPPDHLGFRLIREVEQGPPIARLWDALQRMTQPSG